MNVNTGQYVEIPQFLSESAPTAAELTAIAEQLNSTVGEIVQVTGTREAVEALSHRVRLGAAEVERRRRRRALSAESRRRNRS